MVTLQLRALARLLLYSGRAALRALAVSLRTHRQRGKNKMTYRISKTSFVPGQCAVVLLASALVAPAVAQQTPSDSQSTPAAMTSQPSSTPPAAPTATAPTD